MLLEGQAKKLKIIIPESEKVYQRSLYEAIVFAVWRSIEIQGIWENTHFAGKRGSADHWVLPITRCLHQLGLQEK